MKLAAGKFVRPAKMTLGRLCNLCDSSAGICARNSQTGLYWNSNEIFCFNSSIILWACSLLLGGTGADDDAGLWPGYSAPLLTCWAGPYQAVHEEAHEGTFARLRRDTGEDETRNVSIIIETFRQGLRLFVAQPACVALLFTGTSSSGDDGSSQARSRSLAARNSNPRLRRRGPLGVE